VSLSLLDLLRQQDQVGYNVILTINGKDVDVSAGIESLEIQEELSTAVGQADVTIRWLENLEKNIPLYPNYEDDLGNIQPKRDTIQIYRVIGPIDPLIFSGYIDADPVIQEGPNKTLSLHARSYGSEVLCTTCWYAISVPTLVSDVVVALAGDLPPGWTYFVDPSADTIPYFRADGCSLFNAFVNLALITGHDFYIGPGKCLTWIVPASHVSPYQLTTSLPCPSIPKGGVSIGNDSSRIKNYIWCQSGGYPVDKSFTIHGDGFTTSWPIPDEVRLNDQYGGLPEALQAQIYDPLKGLIETTWVGMENLNTAAHPGSAVVPTSLGYGYWLASPIPDGPQEYRILANAQLGIIKIVAPLPKSFRLVISVPAMFPTLTSYYNQESIDNYGISTFDMAPGSQIYQNLSEGMARNILKRLRNPELRGELVSFDWRFNLGELVTINIPEKGLSQQAQITGTREFKKIREPAYRAYLFGSNFDSKNDVAVNIEKLYGRVDSIENEDKLGDRNLMASTEIIF